VAAEKARKKQEAAEAAHALKKQLAEEKARQQAEAKAEQARRKAAEAAAKKAHQQQLKEEKARQKAEAAIAKAREKEAEKARKLAAEQERLAQLPGRVIQALESQRHAADAYPTPEATLLSLAEAPTDAKSIKDLWKHPTVFSELVVCYSDGGAKAKSYALRADIERADPVLLVKALTRTKQHPPAKPKKGVATTSRPSTAFKADELARAIVVGKVDQAKFAAHLESAADEGRLDERICWVRVSGARVFFLRADLGAEGSEVADVETPAAPPSAPRASVAPMAPHLPSAAPHSPDFAADFDAAFARADAHDGAANFVKLATARRELAQYSREAFDAGLQELRRAKRYSLESSDGVAVRLSDEERAAGIPEGASLLVYVSRR
jgi:hypothetical protein